MPRSASRAPTARAAATNPGRVPGSRRRRRRSAAAPPSAPSEPERGQPGRHPPGRARSVRDRVLLGRRPQPERPPAGRLGRRLEDRVVAEPARSRAAIACDPAATRPPRERDPLAAARARVAGQRQREHAHVARAAALGRQALERGEQLGVVVGVGGVLAGVAPRPDAGAAAEGVDLEAGVVGERRQAGGATAKRALIAAFVSNVSPSSTGSPSTPRSSSETSSACSSWSSSRSSRSLCSERVAMTSRRRAAPTAEATLPLAIGRRIQRRTVARISACAANSLARPSSARSSISFADARSNGLPSAVPCSSTYVPASVPTTLKSTSALESSL